MRTCISFYDLFRLQMGYVPQDDIVHSQLTVREALYFSSQAAHRPLRPEIEERIDTILEELGILDKKRSLIGSPERKVLSGGQRKRVNIALELISDTPVLFLDEPTSGLSSYDAAGVVDLLKRLSHEGKTIIATIHQPSLEVFKKFDNLIMISRDPGGTAALWRTSVRPIPIRSSSSTAIPWPHRLATAGPAATPTASSARRCCSRDCPA